MSTTPRREVNHFNVSGSHPYDDVASPEQHSPTSFIAEKGDSHVLYDQDTNLDDSSQKVNPWESTQRPNLDPPRQPESNVSDLMPGADNFDESIWIVENEDNGEDRLEVARIRLRQTRLKSDAWSVSNNSRSNPKTVVASREKLKWAEQPESNQAKRLSSNERSPSPEVIQGKDGPLEDDEDVIFDPVAVRSHVTRSNSPRWRSIFSTGKSSMVKENEVITEDKGNLKWIQEMRRFFQFIDKQEICVAEESQEEPTSPSPRPISSISPYDTPHVFGW